VIHNLKLISSLSTRTLDQLWHLAKRFMRNTVLESINYCSASARLSNLTAYTDLLRVMVTVFFKVREGNLWPRKNEILRPLIQKIPENLGKKNTYL